MTWNWTLVPLAVSVLSDSFLVMTCKSSFNHFFFPDVCRPKTDLQTTKNASFNDAAAGSAGGLGRLELSTFQRLHPWTLRSTGDLRDHTGRLQATGRSIAQLGGATRPRWPRVRRCQGMPSGGGKRRPATEPWNAAAPCGRRFEGLRVWGCGVGGLMIVDS